METFDYGGGIYEISSTQDAHKVRVELRDLYPGGSMHGEGKQQQSCEWEKTTEQVKTMRAWQEEREREEGGARFEPFGKKKARCLFDCVKATSSFMLIP